MSRDVKQPKRRVRLPRPSVGLLRHGRALPGQTREQTTVANMPNLARRRLWRRRTSGGARQPTLLAQESYRLYWISRFVTQTAQGALIYALLILLVDVTDASFYNSLFVICAIIPSLAFGLPAGIAV